MDSFSLKTVCGISGWVGRGTEADHVAEADRVTEKYSATEESYQPGKIDDISCGRGE